jgi:murein DD-endopeptidase MepM/ murein hydrolase activator NlpD
VRKRTVILLVLVALLAVGLLLPQHALMPVQGADSNSYHPDSFWYYPWGRSVTHKGVDIFAREGTPVLAGTSGIVLYRGHFSKGGNVVFVLGPKWRVHYYAHLRSITASLFTWVERGEAMGTVGTTGNAAGKPAHLHYSILTPIPYLWRMDSDRQGWKKAFYLDPAEQW